MLQLRNETPFQATILVFPDEQGVDTLYVVLKATFELHPEFRVAPKQMPICMADEFYGDPATTSLKFASEAHLRKPGTDVVVVGEAVAPGGQPVRRLEVLLSVADRTKAYWIHGDRRWKGWLFKRPSRPEPFTRMPLVYERAFGGAHAPDKKGRPDVQPRNPVGRGHRGHLPMKAYQQTLLPNIEDPKKRLTKPRKAKKLLPLGLGFIAPSWQPRQGFAGTYDEAWQKSRAPYLPQDFDPRYFHAAHPDWVFEEPLKGGERVRAVHLSERIEQSFRLPRCAFQAQARVQGKAQALDLRMETVLFLATEEKLALTWRAALPCDKKVLLVEEIRLQLESLSLGDAP